MSSKQKEFITGAREAVPVMFAVCFFGMLFGTTAINSGLPLFETMLATMTVFAGASQFLFLELDGFNAPVWSILLAVFALNFRHVLYSASIGRYMNGFNGVQKVLAFFLLCDPLYGAGEARVEKQALTPSYYFGYGILLYVIWVACTLIGAVFGAFITDPQAFGLDMLLSIYFLVLLMGFRSRPNWLTSVLASGLVAMIVYKLIGSPWHIMTGGLAGICLAAMIGQPQSKSIPSEADGDRQTDV